jgi:tetratricopeptide (TPR) repeat protein
VGQALDCYDHALGKDPAIHYEAASVAYEAGDSLRLMRTLRAAVRVAPYFGDGHFELGNALTSAGRSQEAVVSYRASLSATSKVSDAPMALNNLGNALTDVGDADGAMAAFRRGLKLAPAFTYLHNGLANVLSSQARDSEASATLQRALRLRPDAHYAHYNLANALRRLKRSDEVRASSCVGFLLRAHAIRGLCPPLGSSLRPLPACHPVRPSVPK